MAVEVSEKRGDHARGTPPNFGRASFWDLEGDRAINLAISRSILGQFRRFHILIAQFFKTNLIDLISQSNRSMKLY